MGTCEKNLENKTTPWKKSKSQAKNNNTKPTVKRNNTKPKARTYTKHLAKKKTEPQEKKNKVQRKKKHLQKTTKL